MNTEKVNQSLTVGNRSFKAFKAGLATGDWSAFLEMLSDDFTFFFPQGKYQGSYQGKELAEEFFTYVRSNFPQGIVITEMLSVTVGEDVVVFEFRDEGMLNQTPYKNRVAVSFSIRGETISGYREYFGSDGKSN